MPELSSNSAARLTTAPSMPTDLEIRKVLMSISGLTILRRYTAEIYRGVAKSALKGQRASFPGLPRRFSNDAADHAEDWLDLKVATHGKIPELEEGERGIIISNHPRSEYFWSWCKQAARFSPDLRPIGKKEMLYDPRTMPLILGIPAAAGGMMIPIDRKNRQSAVDSIRKGCERIFQPGNALFIFPDSHRPKSEKVQKDHERWVEQYPNIAEDMPYTCVPRSRGLMTVLQATKQYPVRILDMTVSSDVAPDNPEVFGSTVHFDFEEVTRASMLGPNLDPKKQEIHLQEWEMDRWKVKNSIIRSRIAA